MEQAKNKDTYQNTESWEDLLEEVKIPNLKEQLAEQLEDNFSSLPTKIQTGVIDNFIDNHMNSGKKQQLLFLTSAPGGSGKTLSFTVPTILEIIRRGTDNKKGLEEPVHTLKEQMKHKGKTVRPFIYSPWVIILADTKVLIEQISQEVKKCIPEQYQKSIKITQLYSGNTQPETFGQICITTSQILKTLTTSTLDQVILNDVSLFISDEAEHVYKNNSDAMDYLIKGVSKNEQVSLMFASATLTTEFEEIMYKLIFGGKGPEQEEHTHKTKIKLKLEGIKQYGVQLKKFDSDDSENQECYDEIGKVLQSIYPQGTKAQTQVMVFADSIKQVEELHLYLKEKYNYDDNFIKKIHSKMITRQIKDNYGNAKTVVDQKQNNTQLKSIFQAFRNGNFRVLLCTDIMARGIDIDQVGLVINMFPPRVNMTKNDSEIVGPQYMHRIARTGRYIKLGVTLTFYRNSKSPKFTIPDNQLEVALKENVEGLQSNEITELSIDKGYIDIIKKDTDEAVEFNTDKTKKIEKIAEQQ